MSKEAIQASIESMRNETQRRANTRDRLANILTDLNAEKLDAAGAEAVILDVVNLAPEFFSWLAGQSVASINSTIVSTDPPTGVPADGQQWIQYIP